MSKRIEQMKPWQGALIVLAHVTAGLLFWMLLSPEEAGAGGTIAVIALVSISVVLIVANVVFKKPARSSDRPPDE